jgi:hypothetical protein
MCCYFLYVREGLGILMQQRVCLRIMALAIRRVFAILAACGLAASFSAYVGRFVGMTMDNSFRWVIAVGIGLFILLAPMHATNYATLKNRSFFWKGFSQGMPKWVVPAIKFLGLFFIIHFLLFLIESHAASPEIKDGQYVLDNHGQILRMLTQSEYRHLKSAELRLFATGWMFFYFVPLMYWWFPRQRKTLA